MRAFRVTALPARRPFTRGCGTCAIRIVAIGCALIGHWSAAQSPTQYEPYTVRTVAGTPPGSADGSGAAARFNLPGGVAIDPSGTIYVADRGNSTIRKITTAGAVTTFAGSAGATGNTDGTGAAARFTVPHDVALDAAGNLYVADSGSHTIRRITPAGAVTTFAGLAGNPGSTNGTGTGARFNGPTGVAVDRAGNVYVADRGNHTVRRITPTGVVSTFAGAAGVPGSANGAPQTVARFNNPSGVAVDASDVVYVADEGNHTIRRATINGVTTLAGLAGNPGSADDGTAPGTARFNSPTDVAVDDTGVLSVTDTGNHTIRRVTSAGVVSTLAGLAGSAGSSDGRGAAARFTSPSGVAVIGRSEIFVGDSGNNVVRRVTTAGDVSTFAGTSSVGSSDGAGTDVRFGSPEGLAADAVQRIWVADALNHTIRRGTPQGAVATIAGAPGLAGGADGSGSGARFNSPSSTAVDRDGNIIVADTGNHTIRKMTPAGVVTTVAGSAGASGLADGIGAAVRFTRPQGVAADGAGNVYVADTGNDALRKIAPNGSTTTLASGRTSGLNSPAGVAVDSAGTIYLADTGNHVIRKITPAGAISTLAGSVGLRGNVDGTGGAARFDSPRKIALDGKGNVFVANTGGHTLRKITPGGAVTTLAGAPGVAGIADGAGAAARFFEPAGITVSSGGELFVADRRNGTMRAAVPLEAPVIISPLSLRMTVGQPFFYLCRATGNPSNYGVFSLPDGLNFDPVLNAIIGVPQTTGDSFAGITATNAAGTTSETIAITVQNVPGSGLTIISSSSVSGRVGRPFRFQVITKGGSASTEVRATNLPPGISIDSKTGLISGTPAVDGSWGVTLTAVDGPASVSSTLQITFNADPAVPVIISDDSLTLVPGQSVQYQIRAPATVSGSDPTTFARVGPLPPGLGFDAGSGTIAGTYTPPQPRRRGSALSGGVITNVQLFAANSRGTSTISLVFFLAPTGVVNISTRVAVGTGPDVLIGGFIITGNAPKKVIIRGIGPSIKVDGISVFGTLQDPMLELREGDTLLGDNDDWRSAQEAEIIATGVPPSDNREPALIAILKPGFYTATVTGKNDTRGIALVEVYDLGTASIDATSDAKLANISTRGVVQSADDKVMIGGFIISGASARVIVRAIGPSLVAQGVAGALADTTLDLVDGNGSRIVFNDDWRTGDQEQQIIDTTVPPQNDKESAAVATLSAGAYTAIVRGKDGTAGVGLVEIYVLQ